METGSSIHLEDSIQGQQQTAPVKTGIATWKNLAGIAAALVVVSKFYYFRELAAALLIFTILFLMFVAIVGAIYLVGRAGEKGLEMAEPAARRGLVLAEEISKKTFHRPRSVPVP